MACPLEDCLQSEAHGEWLHRNRWSGGVRTPRPLSVQGIGEPNSGLPGPHRLRAPWTTIHSGADEREGSGKCHEPQ